MALPVSSPRVRRILVVEDDEALRGVIVRHFRRRSFEVRDFADAESVMADIVATSPAACSPYDIVLADVHLPRLSGIELARLMQARWPTQQIVLVTGDRDEATARVALRRGVAGYLLKPFELFELDAAINPTLSRLELLEAARAIAKADADALQEEPALGGILPNAWLAIADDRSGAGAGHGDRVAQIAGALTVALSRSISTAERGAIDLASRAHEVGRLIDDVPEDIGTGMPSATQLMSEEPDRVGLAMRSARLLTNLGFPQAPIGFIRSSCERWDGAGGPDALIGPDIPLGSMVLAVADALDHAAVDLIPTAGIHQAMSKSIERVTALGGVAFDECVIRAVHETGSVIDAIWRQALVQSVAPLLDGAAHPISGRPRRNEAGVAR